MPHSRLLLVFCTFGVVAQYVQIPFNDSHSVGPDGPWWPITLGVGWPVQPLDTYPTVGSVSSWWVAESNCAMQNQSCIPGASYYKTTTYSGSRDFNYDNSSALMLDEFFGSATSLDLAGSFGYWHAERITLPGPAYEDGLAQVTSNYTAVQFPGGASYVPLSTITLNPDSLPVLSSRNVSQPLSNMVADLFENSQTGSRSWALQIGSPAFNISGSLVIGGYDQRRLIEQPAKYTSYDALLTSITLGTSAGASPWTNDELGQNYLMTGNSGPINVSFDASVPYLFLPPAVCDAIANALPISPYPELNLYTWNKHDSLYSDIVTSPSYLNFTFAVDSGGSISIRVPMALLNLILDYPLVSSPRPYFPCSGTVLQDSPTYSLGRAFLQAAFMGQNKDSGTIWLGPAPGPHLGSVAIKQISSSDEELALVAPALWEDTWSEVLKPLATSPTVAFQMPTSQTTTPPTLAPQTSASQARPSLSVAAIAGIAIGTVAAALALGVLTFCFFRARRTAKQQGPILMGSPLAEKQVPGFFGRPIPTNGYPAAELGGSPSSVGLSELSAGETAREKGNDGGSSEGICESLRQP